MRRATGILVLAVALAASPVLPQEGSAVAPPGPDDPRELVMAGGQALVRGDLEDAERLFAAARELDAELALAWLGLAEVRERQNRLVDALPLARRAQELAPEEAAVHRVAGRLLTQLGAGDAALTALGRARELAPTQPDSWVLAALLLRGRGQVAEAAALLAEAIGAGADTADMRRELILMLLADGRPEEAVAAAQAAVERFPDTPGLYLGLGLALAAVPERRGEAPAWLEKALAGGIERPERVRFELGAALLDGGDAGAALPHLEAAAEAMPAAPAVWYRLARARQATGDREGAAAAVARFQELSRAEDEADHADKRIGAALNEAQSLAAANRLEEALARVRELLAESPGAPRALALEAKVLYSLRRLDEALAGIRAAGAADPGAVEYRYLEGIFLTEMQRPEEATAAFERALDLAPALAEAWEQLGRLALSAGRAEEAARRFERALELGAEGESLRLWYADALERSGRLEESRQQMEAYRRLHDGGSAPDS